MKLKLELRSNLVTMDCHHLLAVALVIVVSLIVSTSAIGEETVTFEGTFQGAACVHYKKDCPDDDAHIAVEHDFVLLLLNGKHYFLPNLNRAVKARYLAKKVRIRGGLEGSEIWVDSLDVKKGGSYINVWSWEKQQQLYKGGGG